MQAAGRIRTGWYAGLGCLLLLAAADLCAGGASLGVRGTLEALLGRGDGTDILIVRSLRLPRLITALAAGAALSLSGTLMQAVFRNPLADPHLMGVSGGAGLGAALATAAAVSLPGGGTAAAATAGAAAATALILAASLRLRRSGALLIVGVLLGFLFSALTSLVEFSAREESLKLFYNWAAGRFAGGTLPQALLTALVTAVGAALALSLSKGLDLLLFGEDFARSAGAPAGRIRTLALLLCSLLTGTVTAFCGPIGFVGIIGPHLARRLLGTSLHRHILPYGALCGAGMALTADLISQTAPIPLPAGATMALLGIPLLLWALTSRKPLSVL